MVQRGVTGEGVKEKNIEALDKWVCACVCVCVKSEGGGGGGEEEPVC